MPALCISINDIALRTVATEGNDVISVRVSGTRIDDGPPTLDVTGGSYPEDGESTYLTWVDDMPLEPHQVVTVSFIETGLTSHPGKTIEELFPDTEPTLETDFKPTAEIFAQLRDKPKLHEKFSFRLVSASGSLITGETTPDEHGFGFTVLWDSWRPECAKVSLHSYTLESLEKRGPMRDHFRERIKYGESVRFELVA